MADATQDGSPEPVQGDNPAPENSERCPKCGSCHMKVIPYGQSLIWADVVCASCNTYIREWGAY